MATTGWSTTTKENTNFSRLCKLLIDGGTHVLRKIFDGKHPPHDLKKHLMDRRNHRILKNLKTTNILRGDQWSKLYPSVDAPTSGSFDITLLSLLLRNICNLPTPANGWSNEPAATSISQEDDIVRVKLYRNKLSHISEPALSDADFNKYWNDIETVLLRLGADMAAIDSLRTQSMDPEDEEYYNECLKEWAKNEERLLQAIHGLEEKMENLLKTSHNRPVRPTSEDKYWYIRCNTRQPQQHS
ncbi:E3 ubiquitin-protein ligase DZIP3 [Exaiptasia diaphana]|uniref:DZIP3-like HEPN domain-containing protein n=1 Tax=Exaiptasia diaphana TaxID=2652724 RepID=A0A913Y4K6_EXADI|nr:E3 ubiquitin-protein ligase DZIP3 [Exaiptasia diaphana]